MTDPHAVETQGVEPSMSISHFVRTLRAYQPVIILSTAAVALGYVILAIALYTVSPAQRTTTQQFRLDFDGAAAGHYPNGMKFSSTDITSTPLLLNVYRANDLGRFTTFPSFVRAIFVLESNPDYERMAADYQARLTDPRLSAIDRERIQREWESKSASLEKNDFSINWLRTRDTAAVPETIVRKVLVDVLTEWARYATNEQQVLKYRLSVLSPDILASSEADSGEPIVAVEVLRSKIYKIIQNIGFLLQAPGAELRRSKDGMSLDEISIRLEEIVRFRLEPLAARVSTSGLIKDPTAATRFVETQLAYDQRKLKSAQDSADSIRQSMAVYADQQPFSGKDAIGAAASAPASPSSARSGDGVTPQLTDTFLEKLVTLASRADDIQYRQKLIDDYRKAQAAVIPAQEAVAYDQELLTLVKNANSKSPAAPNDVKNEITGTQAEVLRLTGRVNEIYDAVSRHLTTTNELYTLTAPPVARIEHTRTLTKLALYGVVLLAISLPIIILLCLLHARMREEEATEARMIAVAEAEPV